MQKMNAIFHLNSYYRKRQNFQGRKLSELTHNVHGLLNQNKNQPVFVYLLAPSSLYPFANL